MVLIQKLILSNIYNSDIKSIYYLISLEKVRIVVKFPLRYRNEMHIDIVKHI